MDDTSHKPIAKKAVKSITALTFRTLLLNLINFSGTIALTIFLSPKDFGVFIIASSAVEILNYFADIGLAGALIQKKTKISTQELNATFTVQQLLAGLGVVIAFYLGPQIKNYYDLDLTGLYLFYALIAAFFLASLKTVPSVILERNLNFEKIIIPQIIETVIFNFTAVSLAILGFGVSSYTVAVILRGLSGTFAIYWLTGFIPKLSFSFTQLKQLLNFGIPYQVNSLLAVFKDKVSLLLVARIIGAENMGLLGWAEKWSNITLRYFLDSSIKVSFPMFSRLQNNKEETSKALERTIYFISTIIFPSLGGLYLTLPYLINLIPRYEKWTGGIEAFNLFLISAAIASISTFFTNYLSAVGKIKSVLMLMVLWTGLTIFVYPLFASIYNYTGVAVASVVISFTSVIPYLMVKRNVKFQLLNNIGPSLISTGIMIFSVKAFQSITISPILELSSSIIIGGFIYFLSLILIDGSRLKENILKFINYAKN